MSFVNRVYDMLVVILEHPNLDLKRLNQNTRDYHINLIFLNPKIWPFLEALYA